MIIAPGTIIPDTFFGHGFAASALLGDTLPQRAEEQINEIKRRRRQSVDKLTGLSTSAMDLGIGMGTTY